MRPVTASIHRSPNLSSTTATTATMPTSTSDAGAGHLATHRHFVCGGVASFVNVCVTFPVNKVMFRQQLHGIRFFRALKQLRKEGIVNLYRGLLPPLMQRTATVSLMFGTYNSYKDTLHRLSPNAPYVVLHTLAASGAGMTEAILAPFERIQVVLQVKEFNKRYQNTFHAFRDISSRGVRELYRGTSAIVLRNSLSNVLFFSFREPIMNSLPEPHSEVGNMANAFISGAGLGAVLSSLFFPLNVIKTRMQTVVEGPYLKMLPTGRLILSERSNKWRKMYRGIHINYTRSFISWGIINAVYEFMKEHIDEWSF